MYLNNTWLIYMHVVPKELSLYDYDKYYIGITSRNLEERANYGFGYKGSTYFYSAIKKYGWNNIKHIVLKENLTEYEAKEMEKLLIKYLKTNDTKYGYNLTKGGDGVVGLVHSDKSKKKISDSKMGKKYTQERLENHKKLLRKNAKSVCQYDRDGNFIKEYQSSGEASEMTGFKEKGITNCCRNEYPTYMNYMWKYKQDLSIDEIKNCKIEKYKPKTPKIITKEVLQFDLSGNFINKFSSSKIASDIFNIPVNKIMESAQIYHKTHKLAQRYGYIWIYQNDLNSNKIPKYTLGKPVNQYDLSHNYIKTYSSVMEAIRRTNITTISNVLCKKDKCYKHQAGGFFWEYVNGEC